MSNPTGPSLLRRSRALPIALAASLAGLLVCGLTYAVAGETVKTRDVDLLDPFPEGLVVISDDVQCQTVTTSEDELCRRSVSARRGGATGEQLAEELAAHYKDRGFDLNAIVAGNGRTYFGSFGTCGPQLFSGGAQLVGMAGGPLPAAGDVPGRRDRVPTTPTTWPSTTLPPAATTTVVDPSSVAGDPSVVSSPPESGSPGEVPTETTVPDDVVPLATVPIETTPDGLTIDPATGETVTVPPTTTAPADPSQAGPATTAVPDYGTALDVVTIELASPYPGMC